MSILKQCAPIRIILFTFLLSLLGCGGGSAGTGTTTFSGKLLNTENQPVEGAVVRVVGSTETVQTDEEGRFILSAPEEAKEVQLQVETSGVNASVTVPTASEENAKVGVQLQLDEERSTLVVKSLEVTAQLGGECKEAFSKNGLEFIQTRLLADGAECFAEVSVWSDGSPVSGAVVEIQRRTCGELPDGEDGWISVASSKTRQSPSPGEARVRFRFSNDDANCQYRIVAPARNPNQASVFFLIRTFQDPARGE